MRWSRAAHASPPPSPTAWRSGLTAEKKAAEEKQKEDNQEQGRPVGKSASEVAHRQMQLEGRNSSQHRQDGSLRQRGPRWASARKAAARTQAYA